jgi:acylphosphatase
MICQRVHYQGTVQGVGFRMTTQRIARQYAVAGFVRNLASGAVEVVVSGEPDEIERFLGAVAARMESYIKEIRVQDLPAQSFSSFEIRM